MTEMGQQRQTKPSAGMSGRPERAAVYTMALRAMLAIAALAIAGPYQRHENWVSFGVGGIS